MIKLRPISASRLNDFMSCAFKYLVTTFDPRLDANGVPLYPYEPNAAADLGTLYHKYMEAFMIHGVWAEDLVNESIYAALTKTTKTDFLSDTQVANTMKGLVPESTPVEVQHALLLWGIYRHRWGSIPAPTPFRKDLERIAGAFDTTPILEESVHLNDTLRPIDFSWNNPQHLSTGAIDMLYINGSMAVVIDLKTGKYSPNYQGDKRRQVRFYAAHVLQKYAQVETVECILWYPHQGVERVTVERGSVDHLNIFELIRAMRRTQTAYVQSTDEGLFPPTKNGLCKSWCPVKECKFNGGFKL